MSMPTEEITMQEKRKAQRRMALRFHEFPQPGKLEIRATKPLDNQHDLALAYSPGVAEACLEIARDPANAARYTSRGNLVAVVSNGSAALGLGNIGALASKPIMEGKAVLFKKFANIDCFDIEVNEDDPERLADIVVSLEPTFGAINLEDIKAPDCFIVEKRCRQKMNIPVFHDDQHGTAIVVGAAAVNALHILDKKFEDIKLVTSGGGAAGIACLDILITLGVKRENIYMIDHGGLVYEGRDDLTAEKERYAHAKSSLPENPDDIYDGADMFLGLSVPGALKPEMLARMTRRPIIFALANPTPEIMPEEVYATAQDAIIATGRSDYPNQVNNVLCFPFIFRGALDVGATEINDEMKIACINAIASLARKSSAAETAAVYKNEKMLFGPDYLIPKPFDPRLLSEIAVEVARAAMKSGVAVRPVQDIEVYRKKLENSVYRSGMIMGKVFEAATISERRIIFSEGESERVLRTSLNMLEETIDKPVLIGRPEVVEARCIEYGLPIRPGRDFELINPHKDDRFHAYWSSYHKLMERRGVTPALAKAILRTNTTAIAAIAVHRGDADSMICGTFGQYLWHLGYVEQVLGYGGLKPIGALSMMILEERSIFIADTHVNPEPSSERLAEIVVSTARHIRRFGLEPRIALCSHSQFGNLDTESGRRMRKALEILDAMELDFQYEGEMQADSALDPILRKKIFPDSRLSGAANALVFANVDAASSVCNTLRQLANALEVGPILMGMGNKAQIVTPSITARGLLNIAALAGSVVEQYG